MALTATGGNLIAASQARTSRLVSGITGTINRLAQEQKAENEVQSRLTREANSYTANFIKAYSDSEKSSNVQFNEGARKWVTQAASKQNKMYMEAYGENGTPELRDALRLQQLMDNQALKDMGVMMVQGNEMNKKIEANRVGVNKEVELGRFVRGTSTDYINTFQGLSNNQFNDEGVNFVTDENGQMSLVGTLKNGDAINRNITADSAATSNGIEETRSIGEADLIEKTLGDKWHDPKTGLGKHFQGQTKDFTTYSPDGLTKTTTTRSIYDAESIRKSLLTDYKSKLNADIRNSGFDKTWDQLYRGGFIKDEDGNQMIEGDLAWKTIKDINQGVYNKAADMNDDKKISKDELKQFKERTEDAARRGLANYYSETLAPQNDENLDTKTVKMTNLSQYSNEQKQAFEEDKDSFYKLRDTIDDKDYKGNPKGIVEILNETKTASQRAKNSAYTQNYMTGSEYTSNNPKKIAGVDEYNKAIMVDNPNYIKNLPANAIMKITAGKPMIVMTADEVENSNQKELNNLIFDVSGYDGAFKGYFNIIDKNEGTRTFTTREAAEKLYGAGNVIKIPGVNGAPDTFEKK